MGRRALLRRGVRAAAHCRVPARLLPALHALAAARLREAASAAWENFVQVDWRSRRPARVPQGIPRLARRRAGAPQPRGRVRHVPPATRARVARHKPLRAAVLLATMRPLVSSRRARARPRRASRVVPAVRALATRPRRWGARVLQAMSHPSRRRAPALDLMQRAQRAAPETRARAVARSWRHARAWQGTSRRARHRTRAQQQK